MCPFRGAKAPPCRPLHRGFLPRSGPFRWGARLPPHGTAVRGRTQNFLPGSWLKILWLVHLTPGQMEREGVTSAPPESPQRETGRRGGGRREDCCAIRRSFPHTPSGVQGAQVTARQGRRDRNGRCKPGVFHASDRSDSPKPRQRVRRRLAGAPAAACRSRA